MSFTSWDGPEKQISETSVRPWKVSPAVTSPLLCTSLPLCARVLSRLHRRGGETPSQSCSEADISARPTGTALQGWLSLTSSCARWRASSSERAGGEHTGVLAHAGTDWWLLQERASMGRNPRPTNGFSHSFCFIWDREVVGKDRCIRHGSRQDFSARGLQAGD